MRRLLAAIAAVVMVAGGFIVWQARNESSEDDPGTAASGIQTIWCVREAAAACNAANVPIVLEMTPVDIEKAIAAAGTRADLDTDAIVAPDYWLQRWNKLIEVSEPVAESALIAVQKSGANNDCQGKMTCLVALGDRLSMPSLTTSSIGLLAASLALDASAIPEPIDDTDTKTAKAIDALRLTLQEQDTTTMFTNLLAVPILDAAVMTKADFINADPAQAVQAPLVPNGVVTMAVGSFTGTSLTSLESSLSTALTTNGWDPIGTPPGGPTVTYLNDTYKALR